MIVDDRVKRVYRMKLSHVLYRKVELPVGKRVQVATGLREEPDFWNFFYSVEDATCWEIEDRTGGPWVGLRRRLHVKVVLRE